jgi:hypothetical protein
MMQDFRVIEPFVAVAPLSGARRQFNAGETVACDTAKGGSTVTVEVGGSFAAYFLVERSVFETCCKWKPGSLL